MQYYDPTTLNDRFDKLMAFKDNEMQVRSATGLETSEPNIAMISGAQMPSPQYRTPNILNIEPNSKLDVYTNHQQARNLIKQQYFSTGSDQGEREKLKYNNSQKDTGRQS